MVVLLVVDPDPAPVLEDCDVPRQAVRNAGEEFSEVKRRVGVMTDAEQEHLSIQIVHPADGAGGDMGRKRERIGNDLGGFRSGRGKGLGVIASEYIGQSPERIRNDSEVRRCPTGEWVEGFVVIPRPGGHDQRALGTHGVTKGLDQAARSSLDRSGDPKRGVHEQGTAFLDAECTKLIGYLSPA
jgi:hypothetical protein